MSSIYIEIGQCGCQIGHKLNKKISNSYYSTRLHPPHKTHTIMIDTQPKVLKPFIDNPPKWLDPDNVKYFQYGRGNNWSYGYIHDLPKQKIQQKIDFIAGHKQFSHLPKMKEDEQGTQKGELTDFQQKVLVGKYIKENKEICEYTLDRVRRQLEYADCPMAINVLCSLGGGTGSGLGTKIIQKLNQDFCLDIYSHVVLPNKSGETPLQIYNCILSLSSIQEHSTAICPIENDNMLGMFMPDREEEQGKSTSSSDLDIINTGIADLQARLFKINDLPNHQQFYNSIINQCVISPQMKYVSIFGSSCQANITNKIGSPFDNCFSQLCNQLRVYNEDLLEFEGIERRRQKCMANRMLVMTPEKGTDVCFQDHHRKKLRNIVNPVEFNQGIETEEVVNVAKTGQKKEYEIMFLMNHSNIVRYLEYLSASGRKKYQARAYLWHYKYTDLPAAFENIDSVIDQYLYSAHAC